MPFRFSGTLVILFLTVCVSTIQSQDIGRPFNMGIVFGINVSSFNDRVGEFGADNEYDDHVRISPVIGLHARYQLIKTVSLRTALLFNTRGGSYRTESDVITIGGNGDQTYYTKNYRLNYFEIPLMGEVRLMNLGSKHKLHVRLAAGASCGLPVASTLRYNGYTPTGSSTGPLVDVKESFDVVTVGHANSPLLNSIVELSFEFVNGKESPLFVRIGYSGSLNGVYDQDRIDGYNFNTRMTTWSLTLGRYFMK